MEGARLLRAESEERDAAEDGDDAEEDEEQDFFEFTILYRWI